MCSDLRDSEYSRDELVSEDYTQCREIARKAIQVNTGILLSYSARRSTGTTAPVFLKQAVRTVRESETFAIQFDATGPTITRSKA